MSFPLQSLTAIVISLVLYQAYRFWKTKRHYRRLMVQHGCAESPIDSNKLPGGLDHIWDIFTYKGDDILEEILVPRFKTLGLTFHERIFGQRTFHTADPRNFQAILGTTWESFSTGAARAAPFSPLLRKSMLCLDGAAWKHARGLCKPSFARSQLNDLGTIERHVQNLLKAMPTDVSSGWTGDVELLDMLLHLTLDASTEFFFGKSVDSQLINIEIHTGVNNSEGKSDQNAREADEAFVEAFDLAAEYTMQRSLMQDLYFLKDGSRFRKSVALVHKYVDTIVDRALKREEFTPENNDKDSRYVFLDGLVASTRDPQELRDSVLTLLLAGRDTTAGLLGWIFFFLARNPTAYDRLRREIISKFGTSQSPQELDYPALKSVTYLQWVINETLRIHPVVGLTNRKCAKDAVLPAGGGPDGSKPIVVLKGDNIFLYMYATHRNEDIWGPDAADFKPERWEKKYMGWEFIPFGGGPRVCIGQHFGLANTSYVLMRFCQRFDKIRYTDERDNYSKAVKLTVSAGKGVRVQLHRAENGH